MALYYPAVPGTHPPQHPGHARKCAITHTQSYIPLWVPLLRSSSTYMLYGNEMHWTLAVQKDFCLQISESTKGHWCKKNKKTQGQMNKGWIPSSVTRTCSHWRCGVSWIHGEAARRRCVETKPIPAHIQWYTVELYMVEGPQVCKSLFQTFRHHRKAAAACVTYEEVQMSISILSREVKSARKSFPVKQ